MWSGQRQDKKYVILGGTLPLSLSHIANQQFIIFSVVDMFLATFSKGGL